MLSPMSPRDRGLFVLQYSDTLIVNMVVTPHCDSAGLHDAHSDAPYDLDSMLQVRTRQSVLSQHDSRQLTAMSRMPTTIAEREKRSVRTIVGTYWSITNL